MILGLSEAPSAGDVFDRVRSDKIARRIASGRKLDADALAHTPVDRHLSLEDLFARIEGGVTETLNVIVRADMQGTLEPVVNSLQELGNDEIGIKVLQAAIGDISESDIMLAEASDAIVIGFSVNVDKAAQLRAEASGVEVRRYEIIYKLIEDIEDAITGMLEPIFENVVIGHAEILKLFKLRRGVIAGCRVSDGLIKRNAMARALRGSEVVVPDTKIDTLRRFEDDVAEVRNGFECGIKLASNSTDLQEGDIIEVFEKQQTR